MPYTFDANAALSHIAAYYRWLAANDSNPIRATGSLQFAAWLDDGYLG